MVFVVFGHQSTSLFLFQREHEILAGIGVGYGKSGFWHTKPAISLKRGKIQRKLLPRHTRSVGQCQNVWPWMTSKWVRFVCFVLVNFVVSSNLYAYVHCIWTLISTTVCMLTFVMHLQRIKALDSLILNYCSTVAPEDLESREALQWECLLFVCLEDWRCLRTALTRSATFRH